jgi:hypothetical protein
VSGTVKVAIPCGCAYTIDRRQREVIVYSCAEHERERIERHAAAVESCSHVYRDRNNDLVGG